MFFSFVADEPVTVDFERSLNAGGRTDKDEVVPVTFEGVFEVVVTLAGERRGSFAKSDMAESC